MPRAKIIVEAEKEFDTSAKISEIEEELKTLGWKVRNLRWKVESEEKCCNGL